MTLDEAKSTACSYSCTIEPTKDGQFIVRRDAGDRGPFTAPDLDAACLAARQLFKGIDPCTGQYPRYTWVRSARNAAFAWSRVVTLGASENFAEAVRRARLVAMDKGVSVRVILEGTRTEGGLPLAAYLAEVHQTGGFTVAPAYASELLN